MMFLKICGITRLEDARHAVTHGATAVGFVFWPRSPRFVPVERAASIVAALPSGVMAVGVFVDEPIESIRRAVHDAGLTIVQLHGQEPAAYGDALGVPVLRSVTVDDVERAGRMWGEDTTFLLDASDPVRRGGTGEQVDWARAATAARRQRIVLAGGLTPENVRDAVRVVRPFGVDVSSGVESAPGVKDPEKVMQFLVNARLAFAGQAGSLVQ